MNQKQNDDGYRDKKSSADTELPISITQFLDHFNLMLHGKGGDFAR